MNRGTARRNSGGGRQFSGIHHVAAGANKTWSCTCQTTFSTKTEARLHSKLEARRQDFPTTMLFPEKTEHRMLEQRIGGLWHCCCGEGFTSQSEGNVHALLATELLATQDLPAPAVIMHRFLGQVVNGLWGCACGVGFETEREVQIHLRQAHQLHNNPHWQPQPESPIDLLPMLPSHNGEMEHGDCWQGKYALTELRPVNQKRSFWACKCGEIFKKRRACWVHIIDYQTGIALLRRALAQRSTVSGPSSTPTPTVGVYIKQEHDDESADEDDDGDEEAPNTTYRPGSVIDNDMGRMSIGAEDESVSADVHQSPPSPPLRQSQLKRERASEADGTIITFRKRARVDRSSGIDRPGTGKEKNPDDTSDTEEELERLEEQYSEIAAKIRKYKAKVAEYSAQAAEMEYKITAKIQAVRRRRC